MYYAIKLAYDGADFSGWQKQRFSRGIQEEVEKALSSLSSRPVEVTVAGRTDKGVHARGQVISCELPRSWEPRRLRLAMDAVLPKSIRAIDVAPVTQNFHARHSALWREYVYFLWFAPYTYPHVQRCSWSVRQSWNDRALREACAFFEGEHDFTSFCRATDLPENPWRELYKVRYRRRGALGWVRIRGSAFLTNMVRIMVGSLREVGLERRKPSWIASLLQNGKPRENAGMTAPPEGLFFWNVRYGQKIWNRCSSKVFPIE